MVAIRLARLPQVYWQERYIDIRAHISTCEVSLSGGCLSISGSCVSTLEGHHQPNP